jgi:hypothetical protein
MIHACTGGDISSRLPTHDEDVPPLDNAPITV